MGAGKGEGGLGWCSFIYSLLSASTESSPLYSQACAAVLYVNRLPDDKFTCPFDAPLRNGQGGHHELPRPQCPEHHATCRWLNIHQSPQLPHVLGAHVDSVDPPATPSLPNQISSFPWRAQALMNEAEPQRPRLQRVS